jgi:hypothetical protein
MGNFPFAKEEESMRGNLPDPSFTGNNQCDLARIAN